ncbi:hypothetical protein [Streptosporangium sp. NBC_01756]|uniref:hypothetical protein n=1 Tax=Streptosporangium sp. NBC_01756 TaxID=2975950 RepID=UPI002DDA38FC|nr:hypothetical protein [Streptosporangium sp. NBC_01756]WSC88494.1 hypothetical protein OIE48_09990 [Streptosporangium sp. NBC_01756]
MQPDPSRGRPDHNIVMWGAPGSGKTTLLAALFIALTRSDNDWKIIGSDPASSDYLIEKTNALLRGKVFPEANMAMERYHWTLIGPALRKLGFWGRKAKPRPPTRIGIGMTDAPGGWFDTGRRLAGGPSAPDGSEDPSRQELLDNLERSRGLVFLFDPIREFIIGDAFDHMHAPLTLLAERMLAAGEFADGKLPHHIAVCVTKFDDPRVLETAEKRGLLTVDVDDPYGLPRVTSEDTRELFHELCQVSASGNADMVLKSLDQFFHPDRIRFFATSSIGFYVDRRTKHFDWDDFQNMLPGEADEDSRIRGQLHPINVVEPMLWLGQRLAAARAATEGS